MATTPPITVYLDTSDYSNFAAAAASVGNQNKFLPVFEELLDQKSQGLVEFRYSLFHIIEILQGAREHENLAISRADILERLCGQKCMKDHDELLCLEAIRLLSRTRDGTASSDFLDFSYSNDGNWSHRVHKEIRKDVKDLQNAEQQGFSDRLKTDFSYSRSERRRLKAKWYRKKRKRETSIEILRNADEKTLESFRSQLHGTPENKDLLLELSLGKITYEEYVLQLNKIIFSPSEYVRRHVHMNQASSGDRFQSLLKNVYKGLIGDIASFRSIIASTGQDPGRFQYDETWYRKCFVEDRLMENLNRLREHRVGEKLVRGLSTKMSNGDFPSFDMLFDSLREYTRIHGGLGPTMRQTQKSDVGDIFHSVYLPYVDIFRTDKFFSEVLTKSAVKYDTQIIKKIEELPKTINDLSK